MSDRWPAALRDPPRGAGAFSGCFWPDGKWPTRALDGLLVAPVAPVDPDDPDDPDDPADPDDPDDPDERLAAIDTMSPWPPGERDHVK